MNAQKILAKHPVPWRRVLNAPGRPPGDVMLLDAAGVQVPLFTIISFVERITEIAHQPAQEDAEVKAK